VAVLAGVTVRWLVVVVAAGVAGCAEEPGTTGSDGGTLAPTDDWPAEWAELEDEVLRLVNNHRFTGANCGGQFMPSAEPLERDDVLRGVARNYSRRMAEEGFFDHFDPQGRSPEDRVAAAEFQGAGPIGENIAQGYLTAEDVVRGWLDSPGHCTNMLERSFGVLGVGYYDSDEIPYGPWWTQNFAGSH
jgi:uncharacterized protein YkwD